MRDSRFQKLSCVESMVGSSAALTGYLALYGSRWLQVEQPGRQSVTSISWRRLLTQKTNPSVLSARSQLSWSIQYLTTIPGIGWIVAQSFWWPGWVIGDISVTFDKSSPFWDWSAGSIPPEIKSVRDIYHPYRRRSLAQ